MYILNVTMMINLEKGKEVVEKYKGKEGYSAEGLEHVTDVLVVLVILLQNSKYLFVNNLIFFLLV